MTCTNAEEASSAGEFAFLKMPHGRSVRMEEAPVWTILIQVPGGPYFSGHLRTSCGISTTVPSSWLWNIPKSTSGPSLESSLHQIKTDIRQAMQPPQSAAAAQAKPCFCRREKKVAAYPSSPRPAHRLPTGIGLTASQGLCLFQTVNQMRSRL